MKKLLLMAALFTSISSLAQTTIQMTSQDYNPKATLTASADPMRGGFITDDENYGHCEGEYKIIQQPDFTTVEVSFPEGTCRVVSMDIVMSTPDMGRFMQGSEVPVVYSSLQFYSQPRTGMLKIIGR